MRAEPIVIDQELAVGPGEIVEEVDQGVTPHQ
jgi:hypothetical protein